MINYVHRLASVQEQRLPGTGPEPGIDELPRSVDHTPTNKVRYNVLSMLLYKSIVKEKTEHWTTKITSNINRTSYIFNMK